MASDTHWYVEAFKRACATYQAHPHGGRRTCVPWPHLVIAQVVKHAGDGQWLRHRYRPPVVDE
jgi:hypothetical protein